MTFDHLSDAGKLYFIVYLTEWPCTYTRMRKALFDAGVPKDEFRQAEQEFYEFIAHCRQLSQEARAKRSHAEQRGRL